MNILEVELLTNDIDGTEVFYRTKLGLKIISKDKSSISFAVKKTKLTFRLSKIKKPIYHFAFDIPNNMLSEAFAWMEAKVQILEVIPPDKIADFRNWNAKSFYFYDNNGNILEFIARNNLDNKSNDPFDGSSIISISEIGFVAKSVSKLCDELVEKYELPVFSMQPKLEKFIVMGTETGLFILAAEGKDWYPTSIKAKPFWKKVIFENENKINVMETNY
ncbi:VOC family protein [Flavobacterium sp. W1B]|uniref:VOC family protein n=1 Tax=Flavobacterium sp. W1B TaxID=3394146 RepID=UPI0039BD0532